MIPALVLTAHGSADPRSAAVAHAVVGRIRRLRPELDVRAAFLERNTPNLRDVLRDLRSDSVAPVVTPMLLADAYHARVDIPEIIASCRPTARQGVLQAVLQAKVLGEDPALLQVLRVRLAEAGVSADDSDVGVIVAAVGSSSAVANDQTASVATTLAADTRWSGVRVAFATGARPTLSDATLRLRAGGAHRIVIAPWFLAHGRITDRVAEYVRAQGISMAEPLGSHNLVAATVLDRYEAVVAARAAA